LRIHPPSQISDFNHKWHEIWLNCNPVGRWTNVRDFTDPVWQKAHCEMLLPFAAVSGFRDRRFESDLLQ
jgi:hypothetical protein